MSYIKIYIHSVWETKSRYPFLIPDIKNQVLDHIKQNAQKKNLFIDTINCERDHVHCLFCLNAELSISNAMQLLKGESSRWINLERLTKHKFEWGDEYFAESIGPSDLDRIRKYIRNQEEHHKKITYQEEVEIFLKTYGFMGKG